MKLVVASESDLYPVMQMWDLRNTRSPVLEMSGHQQGILSCAWCPNDETLLMSSGKDNSTMCWNTQTGTLQACTATRCCLCWCCCYTCDCWCSRAIAGAHVRLPVLTCDCCCCCYMCGCQGTLHPHNSFTQLCVHRTVAGGGDSRRQRHVRCAMGSQDSSSLLHRFLRWKGEWVRARVRVLLFNGKVNEHGTERRCKREGPWTRQNRPEEHNGVQYVQQRVETAGETLYIPWFYKNHGMC